MSVAIPCPVSCKNIFAPINASPDEESEINPEIIEFWAFKTIKVVKKRFKIVFLYANLLNKIRFSELNGIRSILYF